MHINSASRGSNASGVTTPHFEDLDERNTLAGVVMQAADVFARCVMAVTLAVLFFHVVPQVVAKLHADLAVIEGRE